MTLPDAQDREKIAASLDANLVVEAAAGTGKTTAMVERIVNLLKGGHTRLAAVTFTHKAAAELRQRLDARIAQILSGTGATDGEKAALGNAAAALADCHIGTIHSFCARLLRERPVEAGISPDFRELDDGADRLLRERAWSGFARKLAQGRHRGLYALFETFGLDLDTLGQGFLAFADYPDIDEWIGGDAGVHQIDVAAFVEGVDGYLRSLARLAPALEGADAGRDELMPICQILLRRFPRLAMPLGLGDAHRLAGLFKSDPAVVQRQWFALGLPGLDKDAVLGIAAGYRRFHEETARPFRDRCLAAVYSAALEAYRHARDEYDALRLEGGAVNFQDLLMTTARMLRDYPEVRADLAGRHARILVDEAQDTDPVQAEILFLLASAAPRERDWRKCPPRPGALFIVGDPKQSIYRFRRADIVVYQEVKRLVLRSGGEVLGLTANFRSQPDILEWVNETFLLPGDGDASPEAVARSGRFAAEETPHSPAYVPLRPGLARAGADGFHGVFRLEAVPASRKDGVSDRDVLRDEARRIARFIRHAVDGGLPLPCRGGTRPARPGDFLVVTYDKARAGLYADAVRALGLECRVSGGGTLGGSGALRLLAEYLAAIDNPDDPVALAAVLRGDLFGVSDPALYSWRKAGNEFSPLWRGGGGDIAAILSRMRAHAELLRRDGPASALEGVADDLGLWALAVSGDDPAMRGGAVAAALEMLRRESAALPTLGSTVGRLRQLLDRHDRDPLPATETDGDAVRVMNLHKTKGLEAPVVFLASTRGLRGHEASLAVRRSGGATRGALALRGGQRGQTLLARPLEWDGLARGEELFLAAERTRLNYVAATRAGAALVVGVHQSGKAWKTAFLPQYEHGKTIPEILPEPDAALSLSPGEAANPDLGGMDGTMEGYAETKAAVLAPSYAAARAKPLPAHAGGKADSRIDPVVGAELAAAYGEALHRALSGADAEELVREFGLPAELIPVIGETVRKVLRSDLWLRAGKAERMFQEAPFTLYGEQEGRGTFLRGVIDLVFREAGGWVVVDFKSDAVSASSLPAAAVRHREQLRSYAKSWERITGERVKETGIYFLHTDAYFPLDTEGQAALF